MRSSFHLKMVFIFLTIFVSGIFGSQAEGATYYISPTGSDSNAGTSLAPWRTFTFAIPTLRPGDTLILKNGTYEPLTVNCAAGHQNGIFGRPITIKAENERQAVIKATRNRGPAVVELNNCSFWMLEGLTVQSGDHSGTTGLGAINDGALIGVNYGKNITLRRNLAYHAAYQAYGNGHGIQLFNTTDSLLEENEVYKISRWGIVIRNGSPDYSGRNIVRRNYVHHRGRQVAGGEACMGTYASSDNLFENNVADGCGINGIAEANQTVIQTDNRFFGNITRAPIGLRLGSFGSEPNTTSQNTAAKDHVSIASDGGIGIRIYGINTGCTNCTSLRESGSTGGVQLAIDAYSYENAYAYCVNCVAIGHDGEGFYVQASGFSDWSLNFTAAFGNSGGNYYPTVTASHSATVVLSSNELGACRVFVPASATSLKGKGKNGADIGANVLYRYEDGVLTNKPLWDRVTGEFPGGALVAGMNDVPGLSRFDVHKRLNVNTNGCSLPEGYGGTTSTITSTPEPTSPLVAAAAYAQLYKAETASLTAPMTVGSDPNAIGGKYISPVSGTESFSPVREASLSITVPATGTYYLWARMMGPDYSSDALYVGIDNSWSRVFPSRTNMYEWVKVPTSDGSRTFGFELTEGTYTIQIGRGEIGVRLDALFLTNNPNEIPVYGPSISPPSAPRNLVVLQ